MTDLKAGAGRSVITPTIGGWVHRDVHDDLYAKALVLESGGVSIAIVLCDLGSVTKADADPAKELAAAVTGIPREHILIAATHTHYTPWGGDRSEHGRAYFGWLAGRIADAIRLAQNRLQPAKLAHGAGAVPGEVFNRRYWMKDGSVVFNPLDCRCRTEDGSYRDVWRREDIVRPAGPTDPEVGVLVVMDEQERPLAVLANYALHYVDTPDYDCISANYFGQFERTLQRMAGCDFVGMLMNGTCGDVNNVDYLGEPKPEQPYPRWNMERVSDVVAAEVYRVWRSLRRSSYQTVGALAVANDWFVLRHREVTPEQRQWAESLLAQPEPDSFGDQQWLERVHASAIRRVAEYGPQRQTQIQAFRIGDLALVGLPSEVFVEVGLEIKRRSPFARTLVVELANDSFGYIPTDKAFSEGSYETLNSLAAVGTAPAMVESAAGLLAELAK